MKAIMVLFGAAVLASLTIASCVTERDHGPGQGPVQGPGIGMGTPPGQGGPGVVEMALLKLKGLADNSSGDQNLALTADQVSTLVPLLKDWRSKADGLSDSSARVYVDDVNAVLSSAQKAYRPGPPQGGPGGQGGPGNQGGPGGPKSVDSLLDDLIKELSSR